MEKTHFVYIIYSLNFDKYYKGYSLHPKIRLAQHNSGRSHYTRQYRPWELVYVEEFQDKTDALKREVGLKKYAKDQIKELVKHSKNIVNRFL